MPLSMTAAAHRLKSVFGSPLFLRRINGWLTVFWVVMVPVSIETGWVNSVAYVSALSLWALVSGHWAAWQAARVEVQQEKEHEEHEAEDIPGDTVERIVAETEVRRETEVRGGGPGKSSGGDR